MKSSLSSKTVGILSIPILAFAGAFVVLHNHYNTALKVQQTSQSKITVIEAISQLLHHLQQERNTSIFRNLELSRVQELAEHSQKVDEAVRTLKQSCSSLPVPAKGFDTTEQYLSTLQATRLLATQKAPISVLLQNYNKITDSLLELQSTVMQIGLTHLTPTPLIDIMMLQWVKESASRLSVNMSWILSLKKPIDELLVSNLIDLRGTMKARKVQALESTLAWQRFDQIFRSVIKNLASGDFSEEASTVIITQNKVATELKMMIDTQTQQYKHEIGVAQDKAKIPLRLTWISCCLGLVLLIFLTWFISIGLIHPIVSIIQSIETSTAQTSTGTEELQKVSIQISQQSTEAAVGIQEIASSIERLSHQIQTQAYDSAPLTEAMNLTHSSANQGRNSAEEITLVLQGIASTQDSLFQEVREQLERFSKIANEIREISKKTKTIHEVAFQTKLLSINASVEAARAGESGRGFAVVANEISALAQVGAAAARDITQDLETNIQSIERAISDMHSGVQSQVLNGKERVQEVLNLSGQCGTLLNGIIKNIEGFNHQAQKMMNSSSHTFLEYSQNLSSISNAVHHVDELTQNNSRSAVAMIVTVQRVLDQVKTVQGHIQLANETLQKEANLPHHNADQEPQSDDLSSIDRQAS